MRSISQFLPNHPQNPYLSNINIYRKKKSRKSLEIWVLFITFAFVILRIANNELLALICRLALFYGNGVYCVFLLIHWKLGTSKHENSDESKVDAYTLRVYTWHKCALSSRKGASCAIPIYLTWRRLLHLLLWFSRSPNTSMYKGWLVQNSYAIFFDRQWDSSTFCLGSR